MWCDAGCDGEYNCGLVVFGSSLVVFVLGLVVSDCDRPF